MKKILFIFIIFFSTTANSNEEIITLATVDNISITNIDLEDEMLIIRALNNFKKIDKNTLQQSAFQGLVDQATKEIEIRNNKIEIKEAITTRALTNLKKKLNDNGIKSKRIFNKIKKKSEIDYAWNLLISRKYSWKLNVNINEIEQKLIALGYVDSNNPETIKEKEKLIAEEKNKKFNFYSRTHLEQAKRKLLIKIIK
jgi:hypothetical protein|tara:strand:- start:230 stop:823 length:594 start_codon:yes stop_codon:yes gene_type:complete